jgi:hypothetical protein
MMVMLWGTLLNAEEKTNASAQTKSPFKVEHIGIAVKRTDMHVWGSSAIMGPDGKVHIYASQWPRPAKNALGGITAKGVKTSWQTSSQIAHYIGDSPVGPFEFVRIAVADKDGNNGVYNSPCNSTIKYIDGKYVLLFIVNDGWVTSQRIVMLVADDLNDKWRPAAGAEPDGTVLRQSKDPAFWDYKAIYGNANPTFIKHDGKYKLYFKAVIPVQDGEKGYKYRRSHTWTYGVALSDSLGGPYIKEKQRCTDVDTPIEDAHVFVHDHRVWMYCRDMNSRQGGEGMLWVSEDGLKFDYKDSFFGYDYLEGFIGKEGTSKLIRYRGGKEGWLERPQVLLIDGKPEYLYLVSALGLPTPYGSTSRVFKMTFNPGK